MNCKHCSSPAQTISLWSGKQTEEGNPVTYAVWRCDQGHYFYTQSQSEGVRHKTEFVELRDMHFVRPLR